MLKPELAQAIAVALHELATNAKCGALSGAKGQVRSSAHVRRIRSCSRWVEAGGPPSTRRRAGALALI